MSSSFVPISVLNPSSAPACAGWIFAPGAFVKSGIGAFFLCFCEHVYGRRRHTVCPFRKMTAFPVLLLAVLLGIHAQAVAQVSFGIEQITGPWSQPYGVASDASGNLYVAQNSGQSILKINAGTHETSTYLTSVAGNSLMPASVWIDAQNNLYIADGGNDRIVEWSISTNSLVATYSAPNVQAVATDPWGNIWWGTSDGNVNEMSGPPGLISDLGSVTSMAFDSFGNLFVADSGSNEVWEYTLSSSYTTQSGVVECASSPCGVYIDTSNNLYVGNGSSVFEYAAPSYTTGMPLSPIFSQPAGIAADPSGNLFVTDLGSDTVTEFSRGGMSFGQLNVGSRSSAVNVNFQVAAGTTISSIKVLDQGATGLEFKEQSPDASSVPCRAQFYSTATACSINVFFTPAYPGQRLGAVQISTSNGTLTTAPLSGSGIRAHGGV